MEAILLVGGLGTRLRPLTENIPKPMLPVAGVPLVVRQIERLRAAGVDHVVLATSYRAEVFADALDDGSDLDVRIDYAVEDAPLGTAGAIRHAAAFLDPASTEPVLVGNGDIVDGHDIAAQVKLHTAADAAVTLYLTRVDDPRAYGCVPTDGDRVTAFLEKTPDPVSDQINAGCYVFARRIVDAIPAGRPVSVERETFPDLLEAGELVLGLVDDAYWRDLGTPESYVRGCADVVLGRVDGWAVEPREFSAAPDARVHEHARLTGGTSVGAGATVGDGARVDGSVVLDDVRIGREARLVGCAIGYGAVIGDGAVLDQVLVADSAVVPPGARPPAGSRISNDE
jgi:mannose-1-phosphate guanylyltransferase